LDTFKLFDNLIFLKSPQFVYAD